MTSVTPNRTYSLADDVVHQVQIWMMEETTDLGAPDGGGGAWVAVDRLRCDSLSKTAQPAGGISTARLSYDYGEIDRYDPNNPGFTTYPPLGAPGSILETLNPYPTTPENNTLAHRFIRIVLFNPDTGSPEVVWAGFITSNSDTELKQPRPGTVADLDSVQTFGTQRLQASGPEWLLDRDEDWPAVYDNDFNKSWHRPPFNTVNVGKFAGQKVANAFREQGGNTVFASFRGEPAPRRRPYRFWKRYQILETINRAFDPEVFGIGFIPFFLSNQNILLDEPIFQWDGKSYYQILNELVNPRRYTMYAIDYVDNGVNSVGSFVINILPTSSEDVALGNGEVIPANFDTVSLDVSGHVGARISLTGDSREKYSTVKVKGARLGYVATVQVGRKKDLLSPGWSEEDEKAYKDGPTFPAGLDDAAKEFIRATFRRTNYPDVYTRFVAHYNAPFFVGDPSDRNRNRSLPGFNTSRNVTKDFRWSRQLPLKEGVDYSKDPPVPDEPGKQAEYQNHFVLYRVTDFVEADGDDERYVKHDQLADATKRSELKTGESTGKSVTVRPTQDDFGLSITPQSVPAHWQASQESFDDEGDTVQPVFDWENDLWYTGYFQQDFHVYASAYSGEYGYSKLVIDIGDIAFHDRMMPNTYLGVTDDLKLIKSPDKRINLRDDKDELQRLASLAIRYYGKQRNAYSISYSKILRVIRPGQVATSVDGAATDSMITSVTFDFINGQTNIATESAEPDIRALARETFQA